MTGEKLLLIAETHIGEPYIFGALAPKNDPLYKGPFDCAEFLSYVVYQITGELYGCANNAGDPGGADAYSGFWARDAKKLGIVISIAEANRTPGAVLLRVASNGIIGHGVFCDGAGATIEAHSRSRGVTVERTSGRRWDFGVLIPGILYTREGTNTPLPPEGTIYRLLRPMMRHADIKKIQKKLRIDADGIFGRRTHEAVRAFQVRAGLIADGEVGPLTWAELFK
jgi:N-acetylmuramoyl-L-alanine amidase